MHEALVKRIGGLSLPRKRVVRLTDRPNMTIDVYHGRKTSTQQQRLGKVTFETVLYYSPKQKKNYFFGVNTKIISSGAVNTNKCHSCYVLVNSAHLM